MVDMVAQALVGSKTCERSADLLGVFARVDPEVPLGSDKSLPLGVHVELVFTSLHVAVVSHLTKLIIMALALAVLAALATVVVIGLVVASADELSELSL